MHPHPINAYKHLLSVLADLRVRSDPLISRASSRSALPLSLRPVPCSQCLSPILRPVPRSHCLLSHAPGRVDASFHAMSASPLRAAVHGRASRPSLCRVVLALEYPDLPSVSAQAGAAGGGGAGSHRGMQSARLQDVKPVFSKHLDAFIVGCCEVPPHHWVTLSAA